MIKNLKNILIILFILLIIVLSIIVIIKVYINKKVNKINQVEINVEEVSIDKVVEEKLDEYRNIALFGVDSRKNNLEEGNRSDCIIILSINMTTKKAKVVSVYRDTLVEIDGYGLDKINHAYSYGSAQLAVSTLNKNLDLNIKEFVTINFDILAQIVNNLGGISINIDKQEQKYMNESIMYTAKILGMESSKINNIGEINVDGVQALVYSRLRSTEGGDYKRTERMRNVLQAIVNKASTKSITELNKIIDNILPKTYTNIEHEEIVELLSSILDYKIIENIGWPYNIKEVNLDKFYSAPNTLEENVVKLHEQLFNEEKYICSETVMEISKKIKEKI